MQRFLFCLVVGALVAPQVFSKITPIGNSKAPDGEILLLNLKSDPATLDPTASSDAYAREVQGYVLESLLGRNIETYEFEPSLAESWKISDDKKHFDFTLRPGLVWQDKKPLTVEDVKFSFDVIFTDDFKAKQLMPYYESIEKVEITGKRSVRFTTKNTYYNNFDVVAGLTIIPKHIYSASARKKSKKNLNKWLMGSGPYQLASYDRGKKIILKKNPLWWGNKIDALKGEYNFSGIHIRFINEENVELEMLKKGRIHYMGMRSETFVKKAKGRSWKKKLSKVKTENQSPKGYNFIGLNLKSTLFKSKNVRLAMAHLFNRKFMQEKFEYDLAEPATGPVYRQSDYADPSVKPIEYNPGKALALLRADGWKDSDKDLILDKVINGQKRSLSFTIIEPTSEIMKYLTRYKEDASKVGVKIELKRVEWTSFVKLLEEKKFDAVRLAWNGGDVDWHPKQIWHSESAQGGGSNFISYKNPEVDRLIDEAREIYDKKERVVKLRKVFKLIAEDVPYIFFFNSKYSLYGVNNKIGRPKDTYKYGIGTSYWWMSQ